MSVAEIAECMGCPEGTVTYRLSTARGRIKNGVEQYEIITGDKLYSSGAIPLIAAIFVAETQGLQIPNMLTQIFSTAAAAGTKTAAEIGAAGVASAGKGAVGGAAKAAGKLGLKGLFKTVKAKIIAGVAATAVVAAGVAVAVTSNKDEEPAKNYTEVNAVVCDNEYLNITIDRIYDMGCEPDDGVTTRIEADREGCKIHYTVTNKTDRSIYYDLSILSVNNECMDLDYDEDVTCEVTPGATYSNNYLNNHGDFYYKGRDELTWLRMELIIYEPDPSIEHMIGEPCYYDIVDIYPYGEDKAVNYVKNVSSDKEQVIVDNDDVRVTFVGGWIPNDSLQSIWTGFYVENKSGKDLKIYLDYGEEYQMLQDELIVFAGASGYYQASKIDPNDEDKYEAVKTGLLAGEPFNVAFHVYDYSALGGEYYDVWKYVIDHGDNTSMDYSDAIAATERTYETSFVFFEAEDAETTE